MSFRRLTTEKYGMFERNRINPLYMESQCELDSTVFENGAEVGTIVAVDKAAGKIKLTGKLKGILVNSERIYDQYHQGLKNYKVEAGEMASVLFVSDGEVFTTNTVGFDDGEFSSGESELLTALGNVTSTPLYGDIDATTGVIKITKTEGSSPFTVVKLTTMPDGQKGVKFIVTNASAL